MCHFHSFAFSYQGFPLACKHAVEFDRLVCAWEPNCMLVLVTLLLYKETATFWSWSCPCSIKAAWVSRNTFCGLPTSCITKATRIAILKILQWDLETCRLGMRPSMDHNNVAMTDPRATMAGKPWHVDTKGAFAKQKHFYFIYVYNYHVSKGLNHLPLPGSLVTITLNC